MATTLPPTEEAPTRPGAPPCRPARVQLAGCGAEAEFGRAAEGRPELVIAHRALETRHQFEGDEIDQLASGHLPERLGATLGALLAPATLDAGDLVALVEAARDFRAGGVPAAAGDVPTEAREPHGDAPAGDPAAGVGAGDGSTQAADRDFKVIIEVAACGDGPREVVYSVGGTGRSVLFRAAVVEGDWRTVFEGARAAAEDFFALRREQPLHPTHTPYTPPAKAAAAPKGKGNEQDRTTPKPADGVRGAPAAAKSGTRPAPESKAPKQPQLDLLFDPEE